ncbi:Hypothetical predicted protein [Octopus vulgaris]|uniref:Uncharacterized protein n=1 Tax=Octopus vulgaris TaxID=6645 RepID=A0AA36ASZ4_OCTVU|nr:Hypothetical predicted protein [Octopus vulgaris]
MKSKLLTNALGSENVREESNSDKLALLLPNLFCGHLQKIELKPTDVESSIIITTAKVRNIGLDMHKKT